jgi:hypothetical protein
MQTREIPPEQWEQFFSECTQRHQGQPVTVESVGGSLDGVQAQAFEVPFVQILDHQGDAGCRIEVVAGDGEAKHHVVESPTHVTVSEDGGTSLIEIDAADGRSTRVRFGACSNDASARNLC